MDAALTLSLPPHPTVGIFAQAVTLIGGVALLMGALALRTAVITGLVLMLIRAALRVIAVDATVVTMMIAGGLFRFDAESAWWTGPLTTIALFAWYEIWFYALHRALHTPWGWRIHAQHHVAQVTHPLTSLSFSITERLLLIAGVLLPTAAISQIAAIGPGGMLLFGVLNYTFNVIGHSNHELLPHGLLRLPVLRHIVTPTYHALHHARHAGHYGLFCDLLDRCFRTRFADYDLVHRQTAAGHGLHALAQRGSDILPPTPLTSPIRS
jgi:Delta7-sterol 5-desaturase